MSKNPVAEPRKMYSFRLKTRLIQQIAEYAKTEGRTISNAANRLIELGLQVAKVK